MNPHLDPLPADVAAKAAAVKARRSAHRYVYGQDLQPGMVLQFARSCANATARAVFTMLPGISHDHGWAEFVVLSVRGEDGCYAAVVLDDDGEQQPFYCQSLDLLRIAIR